MSGFCVGNHTNGMVQCGRVVIWETWRERGLEIEQESVRLGLTRNRLTDGFGKMPRGTWSGSFVDIPIERAKITGCIP